MKMVIELLKRSKRDTLKQLELTNRRIKEFNAELLRLNEDKVLDESTLIEIDEALNKFEGSE
ncbi:hypothetical protein [Lysinibacillus sphaericus]|uniref:hypothetical protein n=1 Tax=Lysinibacillus sphaericus TaxID=1421 RepID=UPI003D07D7B3